MGFINEVVFYLSFLSPETIRFVTMRKDVHPRRHERLADCYCRTYRHLSGGVFIIEVDLDNGTLRQIGRAVAASERI